MFHPRLPYAEDKKGVPYMIKTKRILALLLATLMLLHALAACKQNSDESAAGASITATPVEFSRNGDYTTTVNSVKVDLSGAAVDNIEVRYTGSACVLDDSEAKTTKESIEENYPLSAKTVNVKVTDKNSCAISFTDEKASEYLTANYIILFKGVEGDCNTAYVPVEFSEITLTSDTESVVSDATQSKITLSIDGGSFEDDIDENDIYLGHAFSDMKIESVSSSEKNLTLQLKGSPVRNSAGAYQWGSVNIKPSGIKNGYAVVTSKIDVLLSGVFIDPTTLKYENGKISADLKIFGIVDIDSLTKDNIKLDGAAVEEAEKTDDNTIKLTLVTDEITSTNDFADIFGGKTMTIGNFEYTVSVYQADFYPVFDYVEKDGDNLKITLKLYSNSGTFDKDLRAEDIKFSDDFKDAEIESFKIDSETLASLVLSVPSNGQTEETLNMNGTVTLSAGALVNSWGDKTSKEVSYTRDYTGETLGRDVGTGGVSLNTETLLEIQKYTRGLNTTFGTIFYYGKLAGHVYSIAKAVLEATGIVESEHAQVMRELGEINKKLDTVLNGIEDIRMDLINLENNQIRIMLIQYQKDIEFLENKVKNVNNILIRARKDLAKEDPKYADIDWDHMTNQEAAEYNHVLHTFIYKKLNEVPVDSNYREFEYESTQLKEAFETVTKCIRRGGDSNPIRIYDEACSLHYLFDSQAFDVRTAQRLHVDTLLTKAYASLSVRYDAVNDEENANFVSVRENYDAAMDELDKLYADVLSAKDVKAHPGEDKYSPYCYVFGAKVKLISGAENFGLLYFGPLVDDNVNVSEFSKVIDMLPTREWTKHELTVFKSRIHGTLMSEFESAGLPTDHPLAVKSSNNVRNMKDLGEKTVNGKFVNERSYDAIFGVIQQNASEESEQSLSIIDHSYFSASPYHVGIIDSRSANGKDDVYVIQLIH